MEPVLAIVAVVFLIGGGFGLWRAKVASSWLAMLDEAQPVSGDAALPSGTAVKLSGSIAASDDGVLASPFSEHDCVWYRYKVTHEYWETVNETDSNGRQRQRRQRAERVLSDDSSGQPFRVTDGPGGVTVDPRSARIDAPTRVCNQLDQQASGSLLKQFGKSLLTGRDDIGYRHEEWALSPGENVTVLGRVGQAGEGGPVLTGDDLLVSTRTEDQLTKSHAGKSKWYRIAAFAALALGTVLLLASLAV